ncbi:unnamed protein product, partial [Trichogramma brassicae]
MEFSMPQRKVQQASGNLTSHDKFIALEYSGGISVRELNRIVALRSRKRSRKCVTGELSQKYRALRGQSEYDKTRRAMPRGSSAALRAHYIHVRLLSLYATTSPPLRTHDSHSYYMHTAAQHEAAAAAPRFWS